MDADVLKNLTDPAVLFFFLGVVIGLIRSNLEIPAPVAKFLSLYLLMALGFKGGQALADAGLSGDGVKVLGAAIVLALFIPAVWFMVLRRRVNAFDAAAIAATYGSVSAVTFVTASQFLVSRGDEAGGHMTVALVLMESPAIIMAVLLATWVRSRIGTGSEMGVVEPTLASAIKGLAATDAQALVPEAAHPAGQRGPEETGEEHSGAPISIKEVLREAFTDGAHLLLIGSMIIGALSGDKGGEAMAPFVNGVFKGFLAFFLLEMGLLVARQLREVRDVGPFLIAFGAIVPFVNATLALAIGWALGLTVGDLTLLAVLAASGSYIVVPAVVRYAIPEARPSRYFTLALGITFPINIAIGIPLYYAVASAIAG
ncbi:MAG: sodium-dependent bicarbonate transport family permease [Acidimicrobiia bacterium]|nr:sodium-dependent bicarbonate transport family permease [Acidimicrobiia bacterium]